MADVVDTGRPSSFSQHFADTQPQHLSFIWRDINLHVLAKDATKSTVLHTAYKNKHILNGVSGRAESGELLAIMGPTGCGKTSLMNILAARVSGLSSAGTKLTGSIFINGNNRNDDDFRRISAYVLQDDRLYPHLTVQETLSMAAHFFVPHSYTLDQKARLVDSVIAELGLEKARNTIIGDEKIRGISGGERKRANIGTQLISNPSILFLDEPTSGLDSFQAQAVMESMKAMTAHGRLVITVIHQPRSSVFDMFDKLLLLSEGRVIYMGESHACGMYLTKCGFPAPKFFNPADYFLDVLSPDSRTADLDKESRSRIANLADAWQRDHEAESVAWDPSKESHDVITSSRMIADRQPFSFAQWKQTVWLLFWRSWTESMRAKNVIIFKIVMSCIFSGIIGGMYSNVGYNQISITNRLGLLFIIPLNQSFNALIGVLNSFPKEKIIVNRERSANAYHAVTYFVAKFFAEVPFNLIPGFIFGTVIYWCAGLNPDRYGIFVLILWFTVFTSISLGMAVSAISPTVDVATAFGIPLVIIGVIFGGLYINIDSLPPVAIWIPYISFIRWSFQSFAVNEFLGETFECSGGTTSQCLQTGSEVLDLMSFSKQNLRQSVLGLAVMFMFFWFGAIFLLEMDRLTFMPLGHVGAKQRGREEVSSIPHVDKAYASLSSEKNESGVDSDEIPSSKEISQIE